MSGRGSSGRHCTTTPLELVRAYTYGAITCNTGISKMSHPVTSYSCVNTPIRYVENGQVYTLALRNDGMQHNAAA